MISLYAIMCFTSRERSYNFLQFHGTELPVYEKIKNISFLKNIDDLEHDWSQIKEVLDTFEKGSESIVRDNCTVHIMKGRPLTFEGEISE